jgi:peptide/nickel transport system substrate-binding protein
MLANRTDAFFVTSERSGSGPRIVFNVRRSPFDDAAVRRAFSLGVNYESLAKNVMDGVFDQATGFYPTSFTWAIQNQKTDVETAKRMLDEAGWQTDADGIRYKNNAPLEAVFLVYPQQPDWTTLATAMQAQLREIGFDVKIRQVDDINAAMKNTTDWNLAINSPGILSNGGAPDPVLKRAFFNWRGAQFRRHQRRGVGRLIEELSRSFDAAKRAELLKRIQQIIIEEKAYESRPVFVRSRVVVGNKFRDYKPSPQLATLLMTPDRLAIKTNRASVFRRDSFLWRGVTRFAQAVLAMLGASVLIWALLPLAGGDTATKICRRAAWRIRRSRKSKRFGKN